MMCKRLMVLKSYCLVCQKYFCLSSLGRYFRLKNFDQGIKRAKYICLG